MKLILTLAYDGTTYRGFQRQSDGSAIQNFIEKALRDLFGEELLITASGRTDQGVHADEQVISFTAPEPLFQKIGLASVKRFLNDHLPPSIRILTCSQAPPAFHPRFSACVRLYEYKISCSQSPPPSGGSLSSHYYFPYPIIESKLDPILQAFVGTHDFSTFASARDPSPSKVRTLHCIDWRRTNFEWVLDIYGSAFLRSMVRSIIGNALFLMRRGSTAEDVQQLLESRDPNLAKARVPAYALSLKRVFYTPIFSSPPRGKPRPLHTP